MKIEEY